MNLPSINFTEINYTRLATRVIAILWGVTVIGIAYFVWNIDVIENSTWKLVVPKGPIHAGDTITVQSIYDKKRDVIGKSERYLECYTEDDILVTYPINQKKADRGAGKGGTGLILLVPTTVPNLPTKCRVRVSIDYPVLPFRTVHETNVSDEFTLLPETEESRTRRENDTSTSEEPQSTPSLVPVSNQSHSLPNTTSDAVSNDVAIITQTEETQRTEQPVAAAPPEPEAEIQSQPEEPQGLLGILNDIVKLIR